MTINDFVAKWQPILTIWTGAAEDSQFAEDCWAVGFEMDGGRAITVESFSHFIELVKTEEDRMFSVLQKQIPGGTEE